MTDALLVVFSETAKTENDPYHRTQTVNLRNVASITENHDGGCSVTFVSGQHDSFPANFEKLQEDLLRTGNFVVGTYYSGTERTLVNIGNAATIDLSILENEIELKANFHHDSYSMRNQRVSVKLSEGEYRRYQSLTIAMPA